MHFAVKLAISVVLVYLAFACHTVCAQEQAIPKNSPRTEPASMDPSGWAIAFARQKAIEILQSENSCSAWFRQADPYAASTFASLKFLVDPDGPRYILSWRSDSGEILFKHPYAASTPTNVGESSAVTLNAKGAFFVHAATVLWREEGRFLRPRGLRVLRVGSYEGNTLAAQIATLLHEFGHVVGRIPDDSEELSSQSTRNTGEVLHFCRAQIDAAERDARHRLTVLSLGSESRNSVRPFFSIAYPQSTPEQKIP